MFLFVFCITLSIAMCIVKGAGKTSLLKAILTQGKLTTIPNNESMLLEADVQEGIAGGLCYSDSAGINLQVCLF